MLLPTSLLTPPALNLSVHQLWKMKPRINSSWKLVLLGLHLEATSLGNFPSGALVSPSPTEEKETDCYASKNSERYAEPDAYLRAFPKTI